MMKASMLTLALLCGAAPALAQGDAVMTQHYRCDRGAQVEATYVNIGGRSLAVLGFEGRQLALEIARSASGARYASLDPAQPFVWWTKGDAAMLLYGAGDAETTIYADCAAAG